jgi:hypothetical protein
MVHVVFDQFRTNKISRFFSICREEYRLEIDWGPQELEGFLGSGVLITARLYGHAGDVEGLALIERVVDAFGQHG